VNPLDFLPLAAVVLLRDFCVPFFAGFISAFLPNRGVSTPSCFAYFSEPPETPKVIPDDQFSLGDHWVRVDFMRRLGLQYPTPGATAGGRYILIVDSNTPVARQPEAARPTPTKSRWKFWW
jgi:hypothetical protein